MFATDFLFDGQTASGLDVMLCSFQKGTETAHGGEIEFHTAKTPGRDNVTFYSSSFHSVLEWEFSICKIPCDKSIDEMYFSQHEESRIAKWLLKTDGYHMMQFIQDGYEDIYYNVSFQMTPHQIYGRTVGFDLKATSDCGYGYSGEITQGSVLNSKTPFTFHIHSDLNTYILPYIKIKGSGDFWLSNNNDILQNKSNDKETAFQNVSGEIAMDSDNGIISGIHSPGSDFNWYFLRLVDGDNEIATNSETDIEMEIRYREPRRVIV